MLRDLHHNAIMIIALDYDETYSDAPMLFKPFVKLAKEQGHSVTFVTYRDGRYIEYNDDIEMDAFDLGIDVVYTGGKQKSHVFKADIWIDDSPITIPSAVELGDMYDGCLVNNDMVSKIEK